VQKIDSERFLEKGQTRQSRSENKRGANQVILSGAGLAVNLANKAPYLVELISRRLRVFNPLAPGLRPPVYTFGVD
jgi:hypothetical protein